MIVAADLHVHVGYTRSGQWIKIPSSKNLTIEKLLEQAALKGIHLMGIIDSLSPAVQLDLAWLLSEGKLSALSGGGYRYRSQNHEVCLLLGAEIETTEPQGGMAHTLIFLPDLAGMKSFSKHMARFIRNINMSSQNAHMSLEELINLAYSFEGVIIPAHVFTPYKSLYGAVTDRMNHILSDQAIQRISAVEIGLSGDSDLADTLEDLTHFTLLTSSDAHSLNKLGREFTVFELNDCSFAAWKQALLRQGSNRVVRNFGLNPRLGKYHATFCQDCGNMAGFSTGSVACGQCGSKRIVKGVFQRIHEIAQWDLPHHPPFRPPYIYQIPLEFLPGIGPKTRGNLLQALQNEIYILHSASYEELARAGGEKAAQGILAARSGQSGIETGGGGLYGKVRR